ncbi:LysR family transcriptional regulator [Streptomyces spectabilis]|uniref:LysR family transcriptional regulator n=1 Tax=Streptomyces spectabilis TaxID=68270 RepID=UPI0039A71E6F
MRVTQSSDAEPSYRPGPDAPRHPDVDLNLLIALDALLDEGSVRGAARRLHLSEPAMSRTLGRVRKALGDPVLVRAGRHMVATPYALAVRAEVGAVLDRARAVFAGPGAQDLRTVERTLTIVGQDSLAATYAPELFARAAAEAPGVRLRFLSESHLDAPVLREGVADLEVGVIDTTAPEVRVEHFLQDTMIGLVRPGHPLLDGEVTPRRFAAADHLTVSRRGRLAGPLDVALAERGLKRRVVGNVGTYPASLFILLRTDLVGLGTGWMRPLTDELGLVGLPIPLELPPLSLAMAWHPRHDADPAHAWLRGCVRDLVRRD